MPSCGATPVRPTATRGITGPTEPSLRSVWRTSTGPHLLFLVMAGRVPAIHECSAGPGLGGCERKIVCRRVSRPHCRNLTHGPSEDVDGRDKPGHDVRGSASREDCLARSRPYKLRARTPMQDFAAAFGLALRLVVDCDPALAEIVLLSLEVSLTAVAVAAAVGLLLGAALGLARFPGRQAVIVLVNALMGLPPVVVGLLVYLALSNAGPDRKSTRLNS